MDTPAARPLSLEQTQASAEDGSATAQVASKIGPHLQALIASRAESERARIVVTVAKKSPAPYLPDLDGTQPRDSADNQRVLAEIRALLTSSEMERLAEQAPLVEQITAADGTVSSQRGFGSSITAELPLGAVQALAARGDIRQIALEGAATTQVHAYGDGSSTNDPEDVRALLRSDPFYFLLLPNVYIGVVDTGVRSSHSILNPSSLDYVRGCIGSSSCTSSDTQDVAFNGMGQPTGHGTGIISSIIGNSDFGSRYRGITYFTLDSWKHSNGTGNAQDAIWVQIEPCHDHAALGSDVSAAG